MLTSDSDGQHAVNDTLAVAKKMSETNNFTLGIRNFNDPSVPFKSKAGNKITSRIFKLMFGKWISDTQTGLRGIPHYMLKECMKYVGEKYDYEITMLIGATRSLPYEEVIIDTIYIDDNATSHFNPILDSWKIYKVMLNSFFGFMMSSLASSAVDIGLFAILSKIVFRSFIVYSPIIISTVIARICSSLFNYKINKNVIFKYQTGKAMFIKYGTLVVCTMLVSALLVDKITLLLKIDSTIIKIIVDSSLYFVNFYIQKDFVFKNVNKQ